MADAPRPAPLDADIRGTCTAGCSLREQPEDAHGTIGHYRVLDVGCGAKPYEPLFSPHAASYVGVDPVDNPRAELEGSVEALPVDDGSFDVILCNQVLEHCDDPSRAVSELRRVTAPGGRVLASLTA